MQTPKRMTKRQALLAMLAAAPIIAYGQSRPGAKEKELKFAGKGSAGDSITLLDLDVDFGGGSLDPKDIVFLRVTVNGQERVKLSLTEALEILKG